jgi:sugar transferase (PEP-CTERM/EpsH1 system associated)
MYQRGAMNEQPTPSRLRVAHITLGLEVGGQEKLLLEFARHADRARFDLLVIALGSRGRLAQLLEELGCTIIAMDEPHGLSPGRLRRLCRLLRQQRPDVVHTHDEAPLVYGLPAAWWARVRARIHTHHHGRLASVSRRQEFLVRCAAPLARRFVCVSHDSARYARKLGVPARRVQTLHNGIDLARFPFHGPQPDGPVVTVARLSPEKDIQCLLRAARHVADTTPAFRLEIAGDGPCRDELHRLTAELKLMENVRFLGEISDVPALLGRARLFVLPSQTEGVSLTILEAMARGLPVVATRVGGNPEVVADGASGLLVPSGDALALAQAIGNIHGDPETGRRLGLAGRRRAEEHFDVRRMVKRYEALYEELAAPHEANPQAGNLA